MSGPTVVTYHVFDIRGDRGFAPTIEGAIELAKGSGFPIGYVDIEAVHADGTTKKLPMEAFAHRSGTRDEALAFIRDRAAQIAAGNDYAGAWGVLKADPDLPEEEQVTQYLDRTWSYGPAA